MKITLAVLFLAGLTIYCKCTAVLSLPPSLIAQAAVAAASLEGTQQTPKAANDRERIEGDTEYAGTAAIGDDGAGVDGSLAMYRNLKNLWPKNFALQKRERNAFEDDITAAAASAASAQQQLPLLEQSVPAIRNSKKAIQQQQEQQMAPPQQNLQHFDSGNNNFRKIESSATDFKHLDVDNESEAGEDFNDEAFRRVPDVEDYEVAATSADEDDSNEWMAPGSRMTDDIVFPPPIRQELRAIENMDNGKARVRSSEVENEDALNYKPSIHEPNFDYAAPPALDNKPQSWSKFRRPSKYSTKRCQTENENNCPQDYNHIALNADR